MIEYQDLLFSNYSKEFDCYRLVIECVRRDGKELKNFHEVEKADKSELQKYVECANVREIEKPKTGAIVQTDYKGSLHLGYLLDDEKVLHIVQTGARVTPVQAFRNTKYFEVI